MVQRDKMPISWYYFAARIANRNSAQKRKEITNHDRAMPTLRPIRILDLG